MAPSLSGSQITQCTLADHSPVAVSLIIPNSIKPEFNWNNILILKEETNEQIRTMVKNFFKDMIYQIPIQGCCGKHISP